MRVIGDDKHIPPWVASRIEGVGDYGFGNCSALGVIDKSGNLMCGVVFHTWQPGFNSISFSIASVTPRWAHRSIIRELFAYPFEYLKVEKVWTATPHTNEPALRLCAGVGMTKEGTLARHFGRDANGRPIHAIINRLFVEDFVRIYRDVKAKPAHAA